MSARSLNDGRRHLRKLHDELLDAIRQARGCADRMATNENPSAHDESEYRSLNRRIKQLDADYKLAKSDVESAESDEEAGVQFGTAERNAGMANPNMSINTEARYGVPLPQGRRLTDLPDADSKATLDDFGKHVRSLLMNEQRAQVEGTNESGGFLVPTKYAAPILQIAVNEMKVQQAGARVIPCDSQSTQVAKLESPPTPSWRAEGAAISESAGVFGAVTLVAKSLACYCKISLELMEDSSENFGNVIGGALATAFALELDRSALYGLGSSNQPRGVKNTSGVAITPFVGVNGGVVNSTNGDFAKFVETVARLKSRNYQPTGVLYSNRTESSFALLKDSTGQPLQMPAYLRDVAPHYVTNQIPGNLTVGSSTDTSDFFVADWSNLLIGLRTDFRILPLNDWDVISHGQVSLIGWLRADIQLARTDGFEVLSGVRA